MDRIGEGAPRNAMNHAESSYLACQGAPATIQPGAVVEMAEALEEVINDNHGLGYTDPITLNRIESVLRAYYGEHQ